MLRFTALATLFLLAACGAKAADPMQPPLGLETVPMVVPADDPLTPAKAELGKTLFFDTRLSSSGTHACSSCHEHAKGWTDGKQFSAKADGTLNTRNTPSVYNMGYLEKFYWDGRAPSLEKNILAAWKNQMGGKPEDVAKSLAAVAAYGPMFQQAFKAPPSEDTIVRALAAFLRVLRSGDSAFDRWQAGQQDALSKQQQLGYELFKGKAGCIACHLPPLFTDRGFHNTGAGMATGNVDPGAGGEKALNDANLVGSFKTPSLRDVAKTAPYFHDGGIAGLKEAVTFMAGGGHDNPKRDPALLDRKLTGDEIDNLVAFLQALSSTESFTAPVVPK